MAKKKTKKTRKPATRKPASKHTDVKSHNVKISVVSGINVKSALDKLYSDYGKVQANILKASTKAEKNVFRKLLKDIKAEINKVKKLKH